MEWIVVAAIHRDERFESTFHTLPDAPQFDRNRQNGKERLVVVHLVVRFNVAIVS